MNAAPKPSKTATTVAKKSTPRRPAISATPKENTAKICLAKVSARKILPPNLIGELLRISTGVHTRWLAEARADL